MPVPLETPALIARKRDGGELTREEIGALLGGYSDGQVSDAQLAALLMAGVIRGFTQAEAIALTELFVASGSQIDLSTLSGPTVDKHSTGGVGDTTTLIVAPLAAACGLQVAKLAGRGLGHTGGTLDKLESIPGFDVHRTPRQVLDQVGRIGLVVAAATSDLVPLDRRIYALRDVTGTVPSPALIAASVMSKKLAAGAAHVLLDVKVGQGAFVEDLDGAQRLAVLCVRIGHSQGRRTAAVISDMSQPLGDAVGNALEVVAAVAVLAGAGDQRLRALSVDLVAELLHLTDPARPLQQAREHAARELDAGRALEKFREFVAAQGGDPSIADDPWGVLPTAPISHVWKGLEGTIADLRCRRLGELAARLGAGRMRAGQQVDHAVGLVVHVRVGDLVTPDQPLVTIHARTQTDADAVAQELPGLVTVTGEAVVSRPLVRGRVGVETP
ncbi:MAG TPA: thymidine phosphorylase [Nitriliruptorales bacterium]